MLHLRWWLTLVLALALLPVGPLVPQHPLVGVAYADDDDDDDDDGPPRRRGAPARSQHRPELVIAGLTAADRASLERGGFRIARRIPSDLLQAEVARVEGPAGYSVARALRQAELLAPGALSARNDLFRRNMLSRYRPAGDACRERCETFAITGWQPSLAHCPVTLPIGLIDTGVDAAHPSLQGARLVIKSVRREDRRPSDRAHGTGVASLLVGQPGSDVVGALPQASVFAADAFHRAGTSDAADAFDLVAALEWLAESGVRVVNLSLSGPANPVIEVAIRRVGARGIAIVAAAGKPEGGATGYPARYPEVLAVSAVDVRLKPSRLSLRGNHIAFAAPGVGLVVAASEGGQRMVDGTSFAAPFVTSALAASLRSGADVRAATAQLRAAAQDLGAPGRDPIFGWGLIQFPPPSGC